MNASAQYTEGKIKTLGDRVESSFGDDHELDDIEEDQSFDSNEEKDITQLEIEPIPSRNTNLSIQKGSTGMSPDI